MHKFGLKRKIELIDPNLKSFIPIFNKWIQNNNIPQHTLINVADYTHIPFGPGIMLIAFEGNFGIGYEEHGLGFSYNRKTNFNESEESIKMIKDILDISIALILNDSGIKEKIQFSNEYILFSNDRFEYKNNYTDEKKIQQLARKVFQNPTITSIKNNINSRLAIKIKEGKK